jgi:ligand-binding SRPBCC domain-containing protein
MPTLTFTLDLAASLDDLWDLHQDVSGALPLLSPPGIDARIVSADLPARKGQRVEMNICGPLGKRLQWVARIVAFDPPADVGGVRRASFVDEMASGPFAEWRHEHRMEETAPGRSRLTDIVTYQAPLGLLGKAADWLFVRRQVAAVFRYRHEVTTRKLEG